MQIMPEDTVACGGPGHIQGVLQGNTGHGGERAELPQQGKEKADNGPKPEKIAQMCSAHAAEQIAQQRYKSVNQQNDVQVIEMKMGACCE